MCGPIALALPYQSQSRWQSLLSSLVYNLGRISTYTALGALLGLLGRGLFVAGIQSWLSIVLGILMIAVALFSINFEYQLLRINSVATFYGKVRNGLSKLLGRATNSRSMFLLGLLNGLLPCGLVYAALAGAVVSDSALEGARYMAFFGMGTLPLMLLVVLSGNMLNLRFRRLASKLTAFFLLLLGILLLLRGLYFHFPDELAFWEAVNNGPMCH